MAGFGGVVNRVMQVRAWATERAESLALPVSVGLLCHTAVLRLGLSGAALTIGNAEGWAETSRLTH